MGNPGEGRRGQEPRAAAPTPSPEPDARCPMPLQPARAPLEAPLRPKHPGPSPGRRAPPRPAVPLGSGACRARAGRRAPSPSCARSGACRRAGLDGREAPAAAESLAGRADAGAGARSPAAPPPRAQLCSSAAAAAAAGPHNGSGRAVTHPAPAGPAPTRGPPQDPTCSPQPLLPHPTRCRGRGRRSPRPQSRDSRTTLLFASSPCKSPGSDPSADASPSNVGN